MGFGQHQHFGSDAEYYAFDRNVFVKLSERDPNHPSRRYPAGPSNSNRGYQSHRPERGHFLADNRGNHSNNSRRNAAQTYPQNAPPQQVQEHLQGAGPAPHRGGKFTNARGRGSVRGTPSRTREPSKYDLRKFAMDEDVTCPQCSKSVRKTDGNGYKCPKCRLNVGDWILKRATVEQAKRHREPHPATAAAEADGKFNG